MTAQREGRAARLEPSLGQRFESSLQSLLPRESRIFGLLLGLAAVTGVLIWQVPLYVPLTAMVLPMVLASLLLGPRQLPWFVVLSLLILSVLVPVRDVKLDQRTISAVVILFAFGFIIMLASFRRSSLGVAGVRGESMLVDLRDRILRQGGMPELPSEWYAASELRSAGGTAFAGDFVVTARDGDRLNVAVVDVSGKGEGAGTRALLLSGALGGLIGALPQAEFLAAANDFLMRQDWEEGFATAVHLSVDLSTGRYAIRSAGHPPAALRVAGTGRWSVLEAEGPALGLIAKATYDAVEGTMRPGDALLLYTDGMVETPHRDIMLGVDKMLGRAELLLRGEFDGGAARLIEAIGSRNDDRALLLLHRR
ncbi:PP2C family protein-serine/threonine phosphatase [Nocardioides currus]|uniref:Serine/threonine-protein phosphatase n=1 Tax=Nocardioides currus TaxID=2133958 RepID=A0A2R7YYJ5_9ACTN|nr:PP2C family protein-serine/threonine phosphatase [Nocardioides currus]PUA80949.1 serine/threonine-protein phosphatase [Nocardioides currus]